MIRGSWQPTIACMTVITGIRTLDMAGTLIIRMAAGTGSGYRQMICSRRQPAITRMTIITGVGALDMAGTLIVCMAAGAGAGH